MNSTISANQTQNNWQVLPLTEHQEYMGTVSSLFKRVSHLYYKSPDETLQRIARSSSTLRCSVLVAGNVALAFIIYKSGLVENPRTGQMNAFEIRHLEVLENGHGYRTRLYQEANNMAQREKAEVLQIYVPQKRDDLSRFFLDKHYTITKSTQSESHHTLDLLQKRIPIAETEQAPVIRKRGREEEGEVSGAKRAAIEKPPVVDVLKQVTLKKVYIHQIRNGSKTIEGRINDGMFRYFQPGQRVRFFYMADPTDDVVCRIKAIRPYESFFAMLTAEGFNKCLPTSPSLARAASEYDGIPNYTEKAKKFGVLAIELELINPNKV